jgi:hypothetical protein
MYMGISMKEYPDNAIGNSSSLNESQKDNQLSLPDALV